MNQIDIEKYAFLYFCGKKDRDILNGKEKMTFDDLERFCYLTDMLGFQKYHMQIWNTFSGQFKKNFENLEQFYIEDSFNKNNSPEIGFVENLDSFSEEIKRRECWKKEFFEHISDCHAREHLKRWYN